MASVQRLNRPPPNDRCRARRRADIEIPRPERGRRDHRDGLRRAAPDAALQRGRLQGHRAGHRPRQGGPSEPGRELYRAHQAGIDRRCARAGIRRHHRVLAGARIRRGHHLCSDAAQQVPRAGLELRPQHHGRHRAPLAARTDRLPREHHLSRHNGRGAEAADRVRGTHGRQGRFPGVLARARGSRQPGGRDRDHTQELGREEGGRPGRGGGGGGGWRKGQSCWRTSTAQSTSAW